MSGALPTAVHQGRTLALERVLPPPGLLAGTLPGLQRGSLVGVAGVGATTLLFSLLVEPLAQGSWAGVVGLPDLGLEAAALMGVDLARVALVPDPGRGWASVASVLLDAFDLVVVRPPGYCRPGDAHRLGARARERGAVLLVACGSGPPWPERPDVELIAEAGRWQGLGRGSGTLRRRPGRVVVSGRRAGARPLAVSCWLPGPDGRLAARPPRVEPSLAPVPHEASETIAWAG